MNEGFMFHGPVYMGTSQEYFDVVYDTGSDWLVVDGKTCRNCQGNVYDTATSTRSKNLGNPVSVRAYGSAILYGTEYSDLVCLNEFQGCVNNFEYFLITANQTGLREPFDGIVGLSRNIQPILAPEGTEMEIGPILPDFLAKAGVISDNRFSFCYQYDGTYFVDFGPPQNDDMDAVEDIRDIPMLDDFYWSQWMQGIAFGDTSAANAYAFAGELYSIFDTGTSVMLLSSDYFESIVVKYMNDYVGSDQYAIQQGAVYSECFDTTEMPGMYFLFNNTWIELLPDDFMIDVSEAQDRSICMLMFIENSYPFNLFGSPLFMGYYSIHDTANDKISWAPSVGSYKSVLISGKVPKQ